MLMFSSCNIRKEKDLEISSSPSTISLISAANCRAYNLKVTSNMENGNKPTLNLQCVSSIGTSGKKQDSPIITA